MTSATTWFQWATAGEPAHGIATVRDLEAAGWVKLRQEGRYGCWLMTRGTMGRTVILYHGACMDGHGAAWAAWKKYADTADYKPVSYGHEPPDGLGGKDILLFDFSYPRSVLERLRAEAGSLIVADHHQTAAEDLAGFPDATFDMERSGATLAWAHLFPASPPPPLLQYVEDRDLWRFALPFSREVNAALWSYPMDFATWDVLDLRLRESVITLAEEGRHVLRYQQRLVSDQVKHASFQAIAGYNVPVVNASVLFSEVADALCRRFPKAPFAAYWCRRADGKYQWGLRSRDGFNVSEVARQYGGGGHPAAAGFVMEEGESL